MGPTGPKGLLMLSHIHRNSLQDTLRNHFETTIMALAILGLSAAATYAAPMQPITRRLVQAPGATLSVELQSDPERLGALWLDMTVTNTSEKDAFLPGGEHRNGLVFHLTTEDGRQILDGDSERTEDIRLEAGGSLQRRIDLNRRALYLPSVGALQRIVELDGIRDPYLADETHLYLHVSQLGDGASLDIEPIPVLLDVPQLLNRRRKFHALHQEASAQIWDPDRPVNPEPAYAPGVILVSFRPEVTLEQARRMVESRGYSVQGTHLFQAPTRMLTVAVPRGDEAQAVDELRSLRSVTYADLDLIHTIF